LEGTFLLGIGRGSDIHHIHIVVVDQLVGIVVPARDVVAFGIIFRQCAVAPHHCDEAGMSRLVERRPTFDLGDITYANDSPADGSHLVLPLGWLSEKGTVRTRLRPDGLSLATERARAACVGCTDRRRFCQTIGRHPPACCPADTLSPVCPVWSCLRKRCNLSACAWFQH